MDAGEIVASGTLSALILAGSAWLGRAAIGHWLLDHLATDLLRERNNHERELQEKALKHQESLEHRKTDHERALHTEVEVLRSGLQRDYARQSLIFTKLHEKRVAAIESVYTTLIPLKDEVGRLVSAFQPHGFDAGQQTQKIVDAHARFKECFVSGRLFLPRWVEAKLDALEGQFVALTNKFNIVVNAQKGNPNVDLWIKLTEEFDEQVQKTIASLAEDMRMALGDSTDDLPAQDSGS